MSNDSKNMSRDVPSGDLTSAPSFIHIRKLSKSYRGPGEELTVLDGLDLDVRAGETVAIVGASGVGKSTLLHVLGTLDRPSAGQVLVDGQDIFRWDERKLAGFRNRNVGYVFQFHHLLPEFTALENVMMPALIGRESRETALAKARELLVEVGLEGRLEHRVGELSGGEAQRVAVARALVREPRLLLADEPTGNLDEKTGQRINDLFLRLNRQKGITTLIATHNPSLAAALERRVRLAEGKAWPMD